MERAELNALRQRESESDEISLADVIFFIGNYWILIVCLALAAGAATYLYNESQPDSYQATATLVVAPSRPRSDSSRAALTSQAYQKLLESDVVLNEARDRLVKENVLKPNVKRLGVTTRFTPAAKPDDASVLEATTGSAQPDLAATITNTWVKVFLEHVKTLITEKQSMSVQVLTTQLKNAREQLSRLEDDRAKLEEAVRLKVADYLFKLEAAVADAKNTGADKCVAYADETRKLIDAVKSKGNLDTREAELEALKQVNSELQNEHARLANQIETQKLQLDAARKQLAQTPAVLVTRKAITDEALWKTLEDKKEKAFDHESLKKQLLITEQPNPLYAEIARRAALFEIEVNTMTPREERLRSQLVKISENLSKLGDSVRNFQSELQQVEAAREAGITKLKDSALAAVNAKEKHRDMEIKDAERIRLTELSKIDRELQSVRDLSDQLSKNWNSATIAAQGDFDDLRLAAPAVVPAEPVVRKFGVLGVAALLGGAMLGLLIGVIHLVLKQKRSKPVITNP